MLDLHLSVRCVFSCYIRRGLITEQGWMFVCNKWRSLSRSNSNWLGMERLITCHSLSSPSILQSLISVLDDGAGEDSGRDTEQKLLVLPWR